MKVTLKTILPLSGQPQVIEGAKKAIDKDFHTELPDVVEAAIQAYREKYMEQKLVREVKKRGGLCEKWNSGSSGWPDRIVLLPDGKIGFVEVKAPGEKPRKIQVHRHDQLRALGYKVFVLDDLGQIGGIIDAIQTA